MKNLAPVFLIFIFLSGCLKKQDDVNVVCTSGCMVFNIKVATGNNTVPVNNAAVELSWSNPGSIGIGPSRLIAKGNTNSNGTISFSFKAEPGETTDGRFSIEVNRTSGDFVPILDYYDIKKSDTVINANLYLPSKARLNLTFKNFNPTSTNDFFEVHPYFNNYGTQNIYLQLFTLGGDWANDFYFGTHAPFIEDKTTGVTAGDQYTYFSILKKRNGIRIDAVDSIYIKTGEVKTYEVDFQK